MFYINLISLLLKFSSLKTTTFWDVTPCNPIQVHRHFGETPYLVASSVTDLVENTVSNNTSCCMHIRCRGNLFN
jgi:hypothetical protein